ncbi:MAG TPA: exopolysaccharide biosynthesis protein [Alphaproteobacteria bacterium]|nr:exopolysaccharide biosynthesis protein [Alphaproteobacteria bacterium]
MLKESMETRTLSELLEDLRSHITGESISLKVLLGAFHERGFGFFLFLFSLPAALPVPAFGINALIALPLLLLTAQQAVGRHTIWLPEKWQSKTISKTKVEGFITSATPWIKRLEFFIRPRLSFMTQGHISKLIGVLGFIMALAVSIPLPLTNTVPSFGIAMMAIGVLMRDGLAVIGGAIVGTLWVILLVGFVLIYGPEGFDMVKDFIKGLI